MYRMADIIFSFNVSVCLFVRLSVCSRPIMLIAPKLLKGTSNFTCMSPGQLAHDCKKIFEKDGVAKVT